MQSIHRIITSEAVTTTQQCTLIAALPNYKLLSTLLVATLPRS